MHIVPLSKIEIRQRQRSKIAEGPLTELREDIAKLGLLHPPVCWHDTDTDTYVLTVGERRHRAISKLAEQKRTFSCDNQDITPGNIPITFLSELLSPPLRFEAELSENIQRVEIDWQDRCSALAELHEMLHEKNPEQTITKTAATIVEAAGKPLDPTVRPSVQNAVKVATRQLKEAAVIVAHLSNPKIANARNASEAYAAILKMEHDKIGMALAKRFHSSQEKVLEVNVRNDDLFKVLPLLESNTVDLILADPPYGIEASSVGFRSRTVHHHDYVDTLEVARDIAMSILSEGFRLCKPQANLFLFTDIKHWEWLQKASSSMGWTPFRRPLIWQKSETEGLAPWGSQGPRITTEFIFFATKGGRGLISSPTDVFTVKRVGRDVREHGAEKPVDLLRRLIECSTIPGDFVLDPCCGTGSTLLAAKSLKRCGLGIELDRDYYNIAYKNLYGEENDTSDAYASAVARGSATAEG